MLGTEFRFVRCKAEDMFGIVDLWATKTERVRVSDLERTVVDGLKQPEHCGGFTEVAKGYWMRRDAIAPNRLIDCALRLGVGAVVRRIGFLLETFEVEAAAEIERLRTELTATYALLDPLMPAEGPYQARWRLRLNVEPDLYDLWHLATAGRIDFATLVPELESKLAFRGRTRDALSAEVAAKEARYKKLWAVRLGQQMASLPAFDDVFRAVRRSLRDAGLIER